MWPIKVPDRAATGVMNTAAHSVALNVYLTVSRDCRVRLETNQKADQKTSEPTASASPKNCRFVATPGPSTAMTTPTMATTIHTTSVGFSRSLKKRRALMRIRAGWNDPMTETSTMFVYLTELK